MIGAVIVLGLGCAGPTARQLLLEKVQARQLLVVFKPGVTSDQVDVLNEQIGATVLTKDHFSNRHLLLLPQGMSRAEAIAHYADNDLVESAEAERTTP